MKLIYKMINTAYSEWNDALERMNKAIIEERNFRQLMYLKYETNCFYKLMTNEELEEYKNLQIQVEVEKRMELDAFGAYSFVNRKEWKEHESQTDKQPESA